MKTIGLTGSIGMGKSTTAKLFADFAIPVFDSDACVHALYDKDGAAVDAVAEAFPGVASEGRIDRTALSAALNSDPEGFKRLEDIVHPLVLAEREAFLAKSREAGAELVLFDIPLLFETGSDADVDFIVVVSAPDDIRRRRVLDRPGMTPAKLDAIIARQMSDEDKRSRADYVIDTSRGVDDAREQVQTLLDRIRSGQAEGQA